MSTKIRDERYPMMSKVDEKDLTPMMRQYYGIKAQYLDYVLFYRLGDFYEMFFDDALKASPILEIALTTRGSVGDEKIPMCGVPYHALESYLKRAFEGGLSIAICEQQTAPDGKNIVERDVISIITPGTIHDSEYLERGDSNYLAAVYGIEPLAGGKLGARGSRALQVGIPFVPDLFELEYADISTGHRKRARVNLSDLKNELQKIRPSEIIYLSENLGSIAEEIGATTDLSRIDALKPELERLEKDAPEGGYATSIFMDAYINYTAKQRVSHIREAEDYSPAERMIIDAGSVRNLELVASLQTGKKKGSLLSVIDYTKTAMGARLLKETIMAPLIDIEAINRRHDFVEFLTKNYFEREKLSEQLKEIYDLERISAKLSYDTAGYRDLISISSSLKAIAEIKQGAPSGFSHLFEGLDPLEEISNLIDISIREEGDGIREGFSEELDREREFSKGGKKFILELGQREKEQTGIKTLKIGFNKVFGYYIDVSKAQVDKVPEHFIRRQTLVNSERYVTEELKELESKVLSAEGNVNRIEKELFESVKARVREVSLTLQKDAELVAEIDLLASFAEGAYMHSYVRPVVDDGDVLDIKGGRHPVIETLSDYIPNDAYMDSNQRFFVLTGPNMAGKSSYLRQNALIILMAQMGAFVPAESARIGLTERIFTRVGASDDLAQGRSTFMVEMKELAYIIDNLVDRSFVILDEVGRGTSTHDGLSIALAVTEYLAKMRAKIMFATHYHELTALEGRVDGVLSYKIEVEKSGRDLVFLRKISRGSESRSFGVEVARLAGVADEVVMRAREILNDSADAESFVGSLARQQEAAVSMADGSGVGVVADADSEMAVLNSKERALLDEIEALDVDALSPRDAWNVLDELVKKTKGRK